MKLWRKRFRPQPLTTRRKLLLGAAMALPVLAIFTFGSRGLLKRAELEIRYDKTYQQLYRERAVGDSLRSEIARMTSDTAAIERLARERYGLVRPGESIYRVEE